MKSFVAVATLAIAWSMATAIAQPLLSNKTVDLPPPPADMSCDDLITNAELKLQAVIDADKKAAALPHMDAAKAALGKNDSATCKVEVQKALQASS
ncbi:MAG TPA: hypothetical protein VG891_14410 [Rhizomicrobium sp.]|nr:hypothetical protein [Rhizomicrobium sp.]